MSNVSQNETKIKTNKPLNLQYVSQVIGDDWRQWKPGDVVTINAQTGTGKTYFITGAKRVLGLIDKIPKNERLIYLCNRTGLKRQIKLDLLKKFDKEFEIPLLKDEKGVVKTNKHGKPLIDFKKLDDRAVFNNVVVSSYHALAETEKQFMFLEHGISNLHDYKWICCDESQFMLSDASFMRKTNLVYSKLLEEKYPDSIIIFISATIDEIIEPIRENCPAEKLHEYTTGTDYSYLDVKYFKTFKSVIKLVENDKSDAKWIIFVTSFNNGESLERELNARKITCKFVKAGDTSEEVQSIINENQFYCKVLISTKFLDNGVNIKDPQVRNIVVAAYEKNTFIQEIGRVRINIENQPKINLYIKSMSKGLFEKINENWYDKKKAKIELFQKNPALFKNDFNMNFDELPPDIFYLDKDTEWTISKTGYMRLQKDIAFAASMIQAFENKSDKTRAYAYVKKQLEWLGLEGKFNKKNMIANVGDNEEVQSLAEWLDNHLSMKVLEDEQTLLRNMLSSELLNISRDKLQSKNKMHPDTANSIIKNDLQLPYEITATPTSKRVDGKIKKYTYWTIIKTIA